MRRNLLLSNFFALSAALLNTSCGEKDRVWDNPNDPNSSVGDKTRSTTIANSPPNAPSLISSNITGLQPVLKGKCDVYADSHTATSTFGKVRSVTCVHGELSVNLHIPAGEDSFSVTVQSSNKAGSTNSEPTTYTRTPLTCPLGYIGVPGSGVDSLGSILASKGNSNWWLDTSKDFCVMKYPSKNNGSNIGSSTAASTPWVSIPRGIDESSPGSAFKACSDNGAGYRLISNTQWQTIARNIEGVGANWSGGAVGNGVLSKGHSDLSPSGTLANTADNDPYFGTGNSQTQAAGGGWEQRRTYSLSNGEIIWDLSGNVQQWVSDNIRDVGMSGYYGTIPKEYSDKEGFPLNPTDGGEIGLTINYNRLLFGPSGDFDSKQNTGKPYRSFIGAYQGITRGDIGVYAGPFAVNLDGIDVSEPAVAGFRCAALPNRPPAPPKLTPATVSGLQPILTGICDSSAQTHSAISSAGSVQSVNCVNGVLFVKVHLPAGSATFNVTASSSGVGGTVSSSHVSYSRVPFNCPAGFIAVPASGITGLGNGSPGSTDWTIDVSKDFCVMKYPAKQDSAWLPPRPRSTSTGLPWVYIARDASDSLYYDGLQNSQNAEGACLSIGARLLSNSQWQTISRNIEGVAQNWSGGTIGSGMLSQGHTDNVPDTLLSNSVDEDTYFGTGNSGSDPVGTGWEQRRTHVLSNGEIIWDIGGNLEHIVSDYYSNYSNNPTISFAQWLYYDDAKSFPSNSINRLTFGPNGLFGREKGVGIFRIGQMLDNVIRRGGNGIFAARLKENTLLSRTGFRCSILPQ